jgi:hypothetical protein
MSSAQSPYAGEVSNSDDVIESPFFAGLSQTATHPAEVIALVIDRTYHYAFAYI